MSTCYFDRLAARMSAGYSSEAAKTGRVTPDDEEDGPSFDDMMLEFEVLEGEQALKDAHARMIPALRHAFSKLRLSEAEEVTRLLAE